jgi:ankyrin repeat protein
LPPVEGDQESGVPVQDFVAAVRAGEVDRVQAYLGAQPSLAGQRTPEGVSVVLLARYHGHLEVVRAMREAGADLDVFDAAALGEDRTLATLLDLDPALAEARAGDGFTALHLAAFFAHPALVRRLLAAGADPGAVAANPSQVQPLHSAIAGRCADAASDLLEAGADPNATQHGGFTPLHAAAQHGDTDVIDLLLAHGADPTRATDDGRDAAAFAREGGHDELARRLSGT